MERINRIFDKGTYLVTQCMHIDEQNSIMQIKEQEDPVVFDFIRPRFSDIQKGEFINLIRHEKFHNGRNWVNYITITFNGDTRYTYGCRTTGYLGDYITKATETAKILYGK